MNTKPNPEILLATWPDLSGQRYFAGRQCSAPTDEILSWRLEFRACRDGEGYTRDPQLVSKLGLYVWYNVPSDSLSLSIRVFDQFSLTLDEVRTLAKTMAALERKAKKAYSFYEGFEKKPYIMASLRAVFEAIGVRRVIGYRSPVNEIKYLRHPVELIVNEMYRQISAQQRSLGLAQTISALTESVDTFSDFEEVV